MKWLGVILVILTLTWLGYEMSRKLAQRPKLIRLFKNALQILEAEIVYSQASVMEACLNISKQIPAPLSLFFERVGLNLQNETESLYHIWEKEVDQLWHITPLSTDEKEIIKQFGRTLGQHDVVQQQKYIQLTLTHLERKLKDAEELNSRYGKMTKSLGFLIGLFIAILLL